MGTAITTTAAPWVPFHPEWLPAAGTRRERFASWITNPDNRRFDRAIANRVFGLVFGRPYHSPVDDLPDPPLELDLLDELGRDFRAHGSDLRRMILVLTGSRAFRLASAHSDNDPRIERAWAMFPLTRLRPEQIIGAMLQAGSIRTIDHRSHLFVRTIRALRTRGFVEEYGDLGDAELDDRPGTISQALLRMNGKLAHDVLSAGPFSASGHLAAFSGDDASLLDSAWLTVLTRRPTEDERAHFTKVLSGSDGEVRGKAMEDVFWALFNAPEFAWNH